jgi:hypothetical protein
MYKPGAALNSKIEHLTSPEEEEAVATAQITIEPCHGSSPKAMLVTQTPHRHSKR